MGVTLCFNSGEGAGLQAQGDYGLVASRLKEEGGIFRFNRRTGENENLFRAQKTISPSARRRGGDHRSIQARDKPAGARRFCHRAPLAYQPACKPGSVRALEPRVTAIPLGRRLPGASSSLPGRRIRTRPELALPRRPYLALLPVGFAVPRVAAARCALTAPFHPYRGRYATRRGGLLLCCTFPGVYPRRALPGTLSMEPGLSSPPHFGLAGAAVRPTDADRNGGAGDPRQGAARVRPIFQLINAHCFADNARQLVSAGRMTTPSFIEKYSLWTDDRSGGRRRSSSCFWRRTSYGSSAWPGPIRMALRARRP